MSERKVLNKYYPPDFDPSKIPKGKRKRTGVFNIRIMAPFNMRCNTCRDYIYKGKKFNSRKENVEDEYYLGLRIFRFYIKCPRCVSEIAFKTDLKNTDYTLEAGATRLFEAEKIAQQMAEKEQKEKEEDEMNPMKVLENRTKASRQEMDQIDTLEELRELNSKKATLSTDEMLELNRRYDEMLCKLQIEQEEEEIRQIFGEGGQIVKRLDDADSDGEGPPAKVKPPPSKNPTDILAQPSSSQESSKSRKPEVWEKSVGGFSSKQKLSGLVVKKTPAAPVVKAVKPETASSTPPAEPTNQTTLSHSTTVGSTSETTALGSSANQSGDVEPRTNEKLSPNNTEDSVTSQKSDNGENRGTGTQAGCTEKQEQELNKVKQTVAKQPEKTATSGLNFLSAYSDSDSYSSDET